MITFPHNRSKFFSTSKYLNAVEKFFAYELENDGEDITANFCIPEGKKCEANILAKSEGVLAGVDELSFFVEKFFPEVEFSWEKKQGEKIFSGEKIIHFSGNARKILKLERVFLNVLSRLSGIATQTKKITEIAGEDVKIAATRKTQWSFLDKKAVHIGGGLTHRMGLFDAILIKENHQIITNYEFPITNALHPSSTSDISKLYEMPVAPVRNFLKSNSESKNMRDLPSFFEVEVETEKEFFEIFNQGVFEETNCNLSLPFVIMLDNFAPEKISSLLEKLEKNNHGKNFRHEKNIFLEASGGITQKNISKYSKTGVDVISLGALTHSVMPVDFSLRILSD